MRPGRGNELIRLALILSFLCLLYGAGFRGGHDWGDDFSQYIAQAKSIVDGTVQETLEESRYRYDHSENQLIGPILYPWGFPLMLSGVYRLFGFDILAMKMFTCLFFLLSLVVVFLLFRGRMGSGQSLALVLVMGINPVFFEAKDKVLSDFPFLFFSLLTLLLTQRALVQKKPLTGSLGDGMLIGACLFVSNAIRANGIVLLPTLLLVQVVENRHHIRRAGFASRAGAAFLAPYAVFLALTGILMALLPSASSYTDQLSGMGLQSIIRNIILYGKMPVEFFTTSLSPGLEVIGRLLFIISIPAVCLGLFRTAREHYLYAIFSALFMALFILWPGMQGLRYIFPVMPFYLFFLFQGLDAARTPLAREQGLKALSLAAIFSMTAIIIFGAAVLPRAGHAMKNPGEVPDGPYTRDSAALFSYISSRTRTGDVVIFSKPRALWLYAGRRSVRLTKLEDIMFSPAKYIACRKGDDVDNALEKKFWIAHRIYANDTFNLYARMRPVVEPMGPPASNTVRKVIERPAPKAVERPAAKKPPAQKKKMKQSAGHKGEEETRPKKRRHVIVIHL